MIRAAAIVLLVALLALAASGVLWVRAAGVPATDGDPATLVDDLARGEKPRADVDLATRYSGRAELLDPRAALPRWHAYPRAQAVALHAATRDCSGARPSTALEDPALAKAFHYSERSCANGELAELAGSPPFVHPSGRSYAALAMKRSPRRDLVPALHVTELASVPSALLDDDTRMLASIDERGWEALARGDRLVLTRTSLVVADHGPFGLARLRFFDRRTFEDRARRAAFVLAPRDRAAFCTHPASSELCWQPLTRADRLRGALVTTSATSSAVALVAAVVLAIAVRTERKRAHADRLHVLRTLTHELRTPATTLGVDIEPLRAAYDEIPESCQEPLLRISDGIARLNRVLHRTARYLELFERSTKIALHPREVSARETFAEMSDEWPEGVALEEQAADAKIAVDVEWLAVAVRNLAENAVRHGKSPATVAWSLADGTLVVCVRDAGTSEGLVVAPHRRGASSQGLGLGLAIVARVAELLGGTLEHEPSPTTFTLRVPVAS